MNPLLFVENLIIEASSRSGNLPLVRGLSLEAFSGEITAVVGESGCGKSLTALAILGLLPSGVRISSGKILLDGRRIDDLPETARRRERGKSIAMIFQEPMTSLNPLMKVGNQIAEVYRIHAGDSRREAFRKAVAMLRRVKIPDPEKRALQRPHQMSGGMRQRIMIAMALACEPRLLLADEPTTALDVTIQAQILELLRELIEETVDGKAPAVLLITHDMGVVAEAARRMIVMYAGREVESGPVQEIFAAPHHPYTRGLLEAIPTLTRRRLTAIPGTVPRPGEMPDGCAFAARCRHAMEKCRSGEIPLIEKKTLGESIRVRCLLEESLK